MHDQPITWTRSSLCSADSPQCVEVATLPDRGVVVRDSKNPDGAPLRFTRAEWSAFLAGAVAGDFDRI